MLKPNQRTQEGLLVGVQQQRIGSNQWEVTLVLRPANEHTFLEDGEVLSRVDHRLRHGARHDDVSQVLTWAHVHGFTVISTHMAARQVRIQGSESALRRALYAQNGGRGEVPAELRHSVVAVVGLSGEEVARPKHRVAREDLPRGGGFISSRPGFGGFIEPFAAVVQPLSPLQVAKAYNFPAGDGKGQGIAIIELGGGFDQADLQTYFSGLGLPVPTVTAVSVDGAQNVPGGDPQGADGEVLLDIEVAGAVAPGAHIGVFFAPNTDQGFLDAITKAVHDGSYSVISISWGQAESNWSASSLKAFDQAFADACTLGISVFAAAGDAGADDNTGRKVADFPSSSPHVTSCGGTRLVLNADGSIANETVWDDSPTSSASGGGFSQAFTRPSYQPASVGAQRGVPDISGNADPNSGYLVRIDGTDTAIGGTSAVAPLLAGLTARMNAIRGKATGLLNLAAYASPQSFRDVTAGNNGGYNAGPGWDPASGLGSPDGAKVLASLDGAPVTPPPVTPPQPPTGGGGGAPGKGCFQVGPFTDRVDRRIRRDAAAVGLTPERFLTLVIEQVI